MIKIVIGMIIAIILSSCSNSNDAHIALNAMGFTDIKITGYKWFACSDDDWFHTGSVAKNPQAYTVNGVVCSGLLFKNSTVRFE